MTGNAQDINNWKVIVNCENKKFQPHRSGARESNSTKTWWRHQMETFSALLAICVRGIHRSLVNSLHKGQWCGALAFSLICAWINGWINTWGWWFGTPLRPLWRHCNEPLLICVGLFKPLRTKFARGNVKMYLQFISFLHTDMTKVVDILSHIRQEFTYPTKSILWVLMSWRHKGIGIIRSSHVEG